MSQMTRFASTGGLALALCAAFAGCSSRTNVSVTGSTPSQFTHVFITTAEVWFNTNQNAAADDSGWAKFSLKTPVTVDLVQQSNGTLGEVASDLRLAPGTYKTILLMPLISSSTAASASAEGATYNQEADFVDTVSGNTMQVALVLPNPEKGIVVPGGTLTVPVGKTSGVGVGIGTSGTSRTSSTTSNSATTLFGQPTTINSSTNSTSTTSNTNNTTTVTFASNFDGNRDVHLFNYSGCTAPLGTTSSTLPVCGSQSASQAVTIGAVLSSNPAATDLSTTGGITGTLTLTSTTSPLTNVTAASDRVAIQASAESLSADGTHHVIVATAPVQTDGTFTIYPLQSNSKNPTAYDVVVHGPNIATIIIKNVTVTTTTPTTTAAASTTGAVATTTASGAVSLGTFVPRASQSFLVRVSPTSASSLPPGAAVTFYQTLTASGEVPYAIDEVGIDPINLNLAAPEQLSVQTIDTGTYSSSGSTITLTSAKPAETAGTYKVAATAPLFADGTISANTVVTATTASTLASGTSPTPLPTTVTPVTVTVPALSPANTAASGSIAATITPSGGSTQGQLLVSHNGAIIGSASLNGVLLNGGSVTVGGLPSGVGNYYLSAIVWSSASGSFKYESVASPVTVSAGGQTNVAVTID